MRYILSLDAGTTSVRAIVFDHGGHIRATVESGQIQKFNKIAAGYVFRH